MIAIPEFQSYSRRANRNQAAQRNRDVFSVATRRPVNLSDGRTREARFRARIPGNQSANEPAIRVLADADIRHCPGQRPFCRANACHRVLFEWVAE